MVPPDKRSGPHPHEARQQPIRRTATTPNDSPNVHVTAHVALVELVRELRPDIPSVIAESVVVEALDRAAGDVLDASWARARECLYPRAVMSASRRFWGSTYQDRRATELEAARPTRADYKGRRHLHSVDGDDAA